MSIYSKNSGSDEEEQSQETTEAPETESSAEGEFSFDELDSVQEETADEDVEETADEDVEENDVDDDQEETEKGSGTSLFVVGAIVAVILYVLRDEPQQNQHRGGL